MKNETPKINHTYKARVERVVDGDTMIVTIDCGFFISTKVRIRLSGYYAPEARTAEGAEATNKLSALLPEGTNITIITRKTERFGRWLATIYKDNDNNDKATADGTICVNDVLRGIQNHL